MSGDAPRKTSSGAKALVGLALLAVLAAVPMHLMLAMAAAFDESRSIGWLLIGSPFAIAIGLAFAAALATRAAQRGWLLTARALALASVLLPLWMYQRHKANFDQEEYFTKEFPGTPATLLSVDSTEGGLVVRSAEVEIANPGRFPISVTVKQVELHVECTNGQSSTWTFAGNPGNVDLHAESSKRITFTDARSEAPTGSLQPPCRAKFQLFRSGKDMFAANEIALR